MNIDLQKSASTQPNQQRCKRVVDGDRAKPVGVAGELADHPLQPVVAPERDLVLLRQLELLAQMRTNLC